MRGQDRVGRVAQRVVGSHRLGREDVHARRRQAGRRQGSGQGRLVHDPAARHVQQDRARLHGLDLGPPDEPARLRRQRGVDGDDVGSQQQLGQADQPRAVLGRLLLGEVRVVGDDAHLEAAGPPGDRLADLAEADDAQRLAAQLAAGEAARSHSPVRTDASAAGTWRSSASISAMVCSAAAMVLPVGALTTITPARVAAARSIRSVPTLATPITDRRGAAAASSSASTRVCERTTSASQPPSSASAPSSASRDSPMRRRVVGGGRMSSPAWAIGSATRMRAMAGPKSTDVWLWALRRPPVSNLRLFAQDEG